MEQNDPNQIIMDNGNPITTIQEEALLRRALLEDYAVPDALVEFQRFKGNLGINPSEEQQPRPTFIRMSYVYTFLAATACLVIAFLLFSKKERQVLQLDEHHVYVAKNITEKEFSLSDGKQNIPLQVKPTDNPVVNDIAYDQVNLDDYVTTSSTLTVPQGKVAHITLPDGTSVWLNAHSRLVYPERFPDKGTRLVKLEGEAYFQVAKDASRPFIVDCGDVHTRVLGTQFNIRHFSDEPIFVTLVEGKVSVSLAGASSGNGKGTILKPGEQAIFNQSQSSFHIQEVDTDLFTTWREGQFYFDGQTLREVMIEIGRWYNMNVIFENLNYLDDRLHFNGNRSWTIRQTLDELRYIVDCNIIIKGNNLVVL